LKINLNHTENESVKALLTNCGPMTLLFDERPAFSAMQNVAHGPEPPRQSSALVSVIGCTFATPAYCRRGAS
jgi:hypothetical protein